MVEIMTKFGPNQPGAVRCADCRFSPGRHGATCPVTSRLIFTLGAWRKCKVYEAKQKPCLAEVPQPKPLFTMPSLEIGGKVFSVFCDDIWIVNDSGAEPAWTFHDEDLVVELFLRHIRHKRAKWMRGLEIDRRRSSFKCWQ